MTNEIRICTAPGTWGVEPVDNPEHAPWPLVLDQVQAAGFDGIELGPLGYLPQHPARLRSELDRRGLGLVGGYLMEPFHDGAWADAILRKAEQTCELLAGAGAEVLVVIADLVPQRSAVAGRRDARVPMTQVERANLLQVIDEVIDRAEEMGLRAALHHHAGTFVEYEDETETVLAALPRLGLCVDTGHAVYAGFDPVELLTKFSERVVHVHLKDLHADRLRRALAHGLSFQEAVAADIFCPLGAGDVDLKAFVRALHSIGYEGWATYEQDRVASDYPQAVRDALRSLAHLKSIGVDTGVAPA